MPCAGFGSNLCVVIRKTSASATPSVSNQRLAPGDSTLRPIALGTRIAPCVKPLELSSQQSEGSALSLGQHLQLGPMISSLLTQTILLPRPPKHVQLLSANYDRRLSQFKPQRHNRIQLCGLACGIYTEKNSYPCRHNQSGSNRPDLDCRWHPYGERHRL